MFGAFSFVFFAVLVLMFFMFIKQFSRVRRFQNRVFDAVERGLDERKSNATSASAPSDTRRDYTCDQCGAAIEDGGEISPSGDFKCAYCGKWSNIHS